MSNPRFINWPSGLRLEDDGCKPPSWFNWFPTKLWTCIVSTPPAIWDTGTGEWHTFTRSVFTTDLGTTKAAQALPGGAPDRFPWAYCFHDDAFSAGQFMVSPDQGQTWRLRDATEREANDRLRDMVLSDPGDPANDLEADAIWTAVEAAGWAFWKKGGIQSKIAAMRSRARLIESLKGPRFPMNGGGILRMA